MRLRVNATCGYEGPCTFVLHPLNAYEIPEEYLVDFDEDDPEINFPLTPLNLWNYVQNNLLR